MSVNRDESVRMFESDIRIASSSRHGKQIDISGGRCHEIGSLGITDINGSMLASKLIVVLFVVVEGRDSPFRLRRPAQRILIVHGRIRIFSDFPFQVEILLKILAFSGFLGRSRCAGRSGCSEKHSASGNPSGTRLQNSLHWGVLILFDLDTDS